MGGKHHLLTHVLGSPGSGKKQLLHVLVLTGTVWLCHQSPGGDVQPRYVAQWELSQGFWVTGLCWGIASLLRLLLPGAATVAKIH